MTPTGNKSPQILDERRRSARHDLEGALQPTPPPIDLLRRRAANRHRVVAGTALAVAGLVAGFALSIDDGNIDTDTVTAGPPIDGGLNTNSDLLEPGGFRPMAASPLAGRSTMASVWTGSELVIWGGDSTQRQLDDGAAYDPRTDAWRTLPKGPLSARNAPAAVWTGDEMILWGGHSRGADHSDGAAYDPVANSWRSIADAPITSGGSSTAVWTGDEMIVLSGFNSNAAAAYDPVSDTWRTIESPPGAPQAPDPQVVWTGSHVVAVISYPGGMRSGIFSYDADDDRWSELPEIAGADRSRMLAWTGEKLVVVAQGEGSPVATYDFDAEEWTTIAWWPPDAPAVTATAWTGDALLLWGGGDDALLLEPTSGSWTTTPAGSIERRGHAASAWANGVFVVWGGWQDSSDGVVLRPVAPQGGPAADLGGPPTTEHQPEHVAVVGPGLTTGATIDQNGPPARWNGRTLPVLPVEDDDGNLVGYFGCRFLERSQVERDDFDTDPTCTATTAIER